MFMVIEADRDRAEAIQAPTQDLNVCLSARRWHDDRDLRKVICCSSGYRMFRHPERCRKMPKARRWCWRKERPSVTAMRWEGVTMFRDDSLARER